MHNRTLTAVIAVVAAAVVTVTGCQSRTVVRSGGPERVSSAASPSPSAPFYTRGDAERALLLPGEVGEGYLPLSVEGNLRFLTSTGAPTHLPSCHRTPVVIPGQPAIVRRLAYRPEGKATSKGGFFQHIALYPNATDATNALNAVRAKARACQRTGFIPRHPVGKDWYTYPEHTTWTVGTPLTPRDPHLRAVHRGHYPASPDKRPVVYFMIDYTASGNALVTTLYIHWTTPRDFPRAAAETAAELHASLLGRLVQGADSGHLRLADTSQRHPAHSHRQEHTLS